MKIYRSPADAPAAGAANAAGDGGGTPAGGSPPGGGGTPAGGAPANPVNDFMAALSPEARAVIDTKGWHREAKTPHEIVARAIGSYTEIEKAVGADRVSLPPKDAQGNRDWTKADALWNALGRPEKADGYKLATKDGASDEDKAMLGRLTGAAHKLGLTQNQLAGLANELGAINNERESKAPERIAAEERAAETALRGKWGAAFDQNYNLASRAIMRGSEALQAKIKNSGLGRDPEFVALLAEFGANMHEDTTVNAATGAATAQARGAVMTPEQAKQEIAVMEHDKAITAILRDKLHPEYRAMVEKRDRLFAMAYPEPQQ